MDKPSIQLFNISLAVVCLMNATFDIYFTLRMSDHYLDCARVKFNVLSINLREVNSKNLNTTDFCTKAEVKHNRKKKSNAFAVQIHFIDSRHGNNKLGKVGNVCNLT